MYKKLIKNKIYLGNDVYIVNDTFSDENFTEVNKICLKNLIDAGVVENLNSKLDDVQFENPTQPKKEIIDDEDVKTDEVKSPKSTRAKK